MASSPNLENLSGKKKPWISQATKKTLIIVLLFVSAAVLAQSKGNFRYQKFATAEKKPLLSQADTLPKRNIHWLHQQTRTLKFATSTVTRPYAKLSAKSASLIAIALDQHAWTLASLSGDGIVFYFHGKKNRVLQA
ncbi:hypothetical protein GBA52_013914 [Prunus armeniaca]|nr:hypothetical protein GBA52_013914 [Prunus armeniaca]